MQAIASLTALIAAAIVLGGCATDNQNYNINHEDVDVYQEGYPTQPAGASVELSDDAAGPSLQGLDRSTWDPIVVRPASGRVEHYPHYFYRTLYGARWYERTDRPSPLVSTGDISYQSAAAVADVRDRIVTVEDFGELLSAPTKFAADLILMPWNMATENQPWDVVSTGIGPER